MVGIRRYTCNDQVKFADKHIKAKCIACELWVKRVGTLCSIARILFCILQSCILVDLSDAKILFLKLFSQMKYNQNILISFNCFF